MQEGGIADACVLGRDVLLCDLIDDVCCGVLLNVVLCEWMCMIGGMLMFAVVVACDVGFWSGSKCV